MRKYLEPGDKIKYISPALPDKNILLKEIYRERGWTWNSEIGES